MNTKTNVVLIHGAWVDGTSWGRVIPLLQEQGFEVVAAQLPLTSLEDDITATRNLMATLEGPIVLAGHSYGGVVMSGAAEGQSDVKALAYIAAFGLDDGETTEAVGKHGPPPAGSAQIRPDKRGFLWIDRSGFGQAVAADIDPEEASVLAAVQKPVSIKSLGSKSGPAAWKRLPSWYLITTNDLMISPQVQEFMAKRMGATTRRIASSHAAIASHPAEVADLIALAAESIEMATSSR